MKKKPKKLIIAAQQFRGVIIGYACQSLTRDQLVAELKARDIPVPKLKHMMAARLFAYAHTNAIPVTVTIG